VIEHRHAQKKQGPGDEKARYMKAKPRMTARVEGEVVWRFFMAEGEDLRRNSRCKTQSTPNFGGRVTSDRFS
jgi:hypothetical protein